MCHLVIAMNERVTLEVDSETLKKAREAGVDLSDLLTRALLRELTSLSEAERQRVARQWYEQNKEAVDASNAHVEKHGLWSDGQRMF
jgi:antitoxin CcdA